MSTLPTLDILKKHRQDLLLAEVAALLHDVGKCTSEFAYEVTARSVKQNNIDLDPYKAIFSASELQNYQFSQQRLQERLDEANLQYALHKLLQPAILQHLDARFSFAGQNYTFREAIYFSRPRFAGNIGRPLGRAGEPLDLLANCHGKGHVEKEEPHPSKILSNIARYSAFGFQLANLPKPQAKNNLTDRLNTLNWQAVLQHHTGKLRSLFSEALGDTRFPINEVTLWDWSYIVASLYKPELARYLLTQEWRTREDLRWRLLRVNFNVLALYAKAIKIADLLAYQDAVNKACQEVKALVEDEYPLGNEIYRDTTGIYFTFPDLDLLPELEQEIRCRVEEIEPELAPRIAVTVGDGDNAQEQLKSILGKARREAHETLKLPFDATNLSPVWQQTWHDTLSQEPEKKWEVCPVCRLRPKEESAEVCSHCAKRRQSRLETWQDKPAQTIWLGEIADHNDRVALLVGKFGLDDWLSGDLVQTMLVKAEENKPEACVSKNPSPARLRRIWETCQRFWTKTVEGDILPNTLPNQVRKSIIPAQTNWQDGLYNGKINGKPLDLFWQPESNAFLTVSNQQAAGAFKPGDAITLENPDTKHKDEFQIQGIGAAPPAFNSYQPYLPLLTSPDQFLAFVPAAQALEIAKKIYSEYQKQFGKVRNRLPLFLGLVYFERKMPLMAVMDAARQMLEYPVYSDGWTVEKANGNVQITFENGIIWDVPILIGDGTTDDVWYPYFELVGDSTDHHPLHFQHNEKTWVYVKNLQKGDKVKVTPSTFDFLWLDSASRRFEIHYNKNGRRLTRPTRPFYLEDLDRLESLWGCLNLLTRTQLKQILQTIETGRERWFGRDEKQRSVADAAFHQFVKDTLANAQWDWKTLSEEQKNKLIVAGARGELTDLDELHLEILKEKKEEKE